MSTFAKRYNQTGKVIILSETTDMPLTLAGALSGICWNSDTSDPKKNYKRGMDCLKSGHGRVLEFPQIYMVLDGWSARVIREFERHIGGAPTYLQASTRYIDYSNFDYITPKSIEDDITLKKFYDIGMEQISAAARLAVSQGAKREDIANLYPLGMTTKVVHRTNLRNLMDMAKVRKCTRAYWEFRQLFQAIEDALAIYSDEWHYLIKEEHIFKCKCDIDGYCSESHSCGKKMPEAEFRKWMYAIEVWRKAGLTIEDIDNEIAEQLKEASDDDNSENDN